MLGIYFSQPRQRHLWQRRRLQANTAVNRRKAAENGAGGRRIANYIFLPGKAYGNFLALSAESRTAGSLAAQKMLKFFSAVSK